MKKVLMISSIVIIILSLGIFIIFKLVPKEISETSLDINSEMITKLYEMTNPSDDMQIFRELYAKGEMTDEYIIDVGIMNYIRENKEADLEYIESNMVKDHVLKTLGKDIEYLDQDVHVLNYEYQVCGYKFNKELNRYESLHGCGGNESEFMRRKIIEAKQVDNKIKILEKSIFFYNDWDDKLSKRFIYNDVNRSKKLDYIEKSSSESYIVNIEDYINEAAIYQYNFELLEGRYIFKNLERIS